MATRKLISLAQLAARLNDCYAFLETAIKSLRSEDEDGPETVVLEHTLTLIGDVQTAIDERS